jgi:Cu+-exporting ATPase
MYTVATVTSSPLEQIDLTLEGLHCAACVLRTENALTALPGVDRATVNLATERASVAFDPTQTAIPEFVRAVAELGYTATPITDPTAQPAAYGRDPLQTRMVVAIILAIPTLALSMIPALQFNGWGWLAGALTTPVALWAAWPFHHSAWLALKHRTTSMDTLISLGVLVAYTSSVAALLLTDATSMPMHLSLTARGSTGTLTFEVAAVVTAVLLTGRVLELRARRRAGDAVRALSDLSAPNATIVQDGKELLVPAATLRVGDLVLVRPGERIPADGTIVDGTASLDRSLLTGESLPVDVDPGDEVAGGSINTDGVLTIRTDRVGADSAAARIARLVEEAQTEKASVQRLADKIASWFVPAALAIAVLAFVGWLATGASLAEALAPAVAVLVVACPCALGLAVPAALLVATGRGAQLGILLRGAPALERAENISTILLDKTGTVTEGRMAFAGSHFREDEDPTRVIALAAAVEAGSEHPIARVIAALVDAPMPATEFRARPGIGAEARVDGELVTVGHPTRLEAEGDLLSYPLKDVCKAESELGRSLAAVSWGGIIRGIIATNDQLRPSSQAAIASMRKLGLEPVLVTGDTSAAAKSVAAAVGIRGVIANVLPEGKVDEVRRLQADGRAVAVVGDGVNDAPALALADLGIAMGSGADVAIAAADITLVRPDLFAAADAVRLARQTMRTIRGNLFWAFAYNVILIPVAALGLLNPMLSGLAMASSSLFVLGNSLRLRRFRASEQGISH